MKTTMSLFSYDEPPCPDGQPPMPSPQTESKAKMQRQNYLIQNLWQSFLTSTTAHGIGRVFQSQGKLKKLAWLISILCMYFVVFKTIVSVRSREWLCHFEKKKCYWRQQWGKQWAYKKSCEKKRWDASGEKRWDASGDLLANLSLNRTTPNSILSNSLQYLK